MKKKTIVALSRQAFTRYMTEKGINDTNIEKQTKIAFISINEPKPDYPIIVTPYSNFIGLFFDDVSEPVPLLNQDINKREMALPMSEEQALELIKFIKRNEDKELFLIHCAAGISRSGAVAEYINDYFRQDYFEFKKENPSIQPNSHILSLLRRAKEAFDILYPPITNASAFIYPSDKTSENGTKASA